MKKLLVILTLFVCALCARVNGANWNDVKNVTPVEKPRPAGVTNGIYFFAVYAIFTFETILQVIRGLTSDPYAA